MITGSDIAYVLLGVLLTGIISFMIFILIQRKKYPSLVRLLNALAKELAIDLKDGRVDPEEAHRIVNLLFEYLKTIYVPPKEEEKEKETNILTGGSLPPLKQ